MTVIFSKGDFWKNGVGTPSTGFKRREYIFERILDPFQRLWREVKACPIHPESPGKGSWNLWILSFQFSGCKTFHPVNSLFQRPWFTSLRCLILGSNIAFFLVMCVSCHIFDVNRYFRIMGNQRKSSHVRKGKGRRMKLQGKQQPAKRQRTSSAKGNSRLKGTPWTIWEGDWNFLYR